jgi:hypothetical protein
MNFAHIIINVRNFYHKSRFLRKCYIFKYKTLDLFIIIRDRPFNLKGGGGGLWFFISFRIFFSDNTRVRIFIFFVQNLTLCYMTKTLHQINFFFLHQNQNIFFSNIGNQNIFLENKTYPSPTSC